MEWHGDAFITELKAHLRKQVQKACIHLKNKLKENIGTGQAYKRYKGKAIYYKGLDPSEPGEFPHKITGHLQRSIAYELDNQEIAGYVGTTVDYGFFLEV